jgi:hypothetical protein
VHAKGDRIISPIEGIAEHLRHVADSLSPFPSEKWIEVLYFEVYGGKIGSEARQYTSKWEVGHRLFDVAYVDPRVLTMTVADIAKWREDGGQNFAAESTLQRIAEDEKLPLVPRLGTVDGGLVPTTREQMYAWLMTAAHTGVALDDKAGGQSEGMVMRTANRKQIVKARIPDYARVCKPTN